MKTIQITVDVKLLAQLDQALNGRPRFRSAFIREAIRAQLKQLKRKHLEELHRAAYLKYPVEPDEFYVDPRQLAWDEWKPKGHRRATR